MKEVFNNLANSFNTENVGFSSRKLTAFSLMICIGYLHYKYADINNAVSFLTIDLIGVFLLLGIVTVEQIIKFKDGNSSHKQGDI
jgi:hypothetical protein